MCVLDTHDVRLICRVLIMLAVQVNVHTPVQNVITHCSSTAYSDRAFMRSLSSEPV